MRKELRVELKNVQSMRGDETPAFSASLYFDGKRVGYIRSEGSGGAPFLDWIDPKGKGAEPLERWRAWCTEKAKAVDKELGCDPSERIPAPNGTDWMSEETAIFALYDEHEERRALRRLCKKQTLFRVGDEPAHEWRTIDHVFNDQVRTYLHEKYGSGVTIANEGLS